MPYLTRANTRLYYATHGTTGPPLLLTHGFSSTSDMWAEQIAPLSAHHRLILWDMRGHGQSDYPVDSTAYSEDQTVHDMLFLLDTLAPDWPRAIVGGLSLGGYMSLAFYLRFPTRVSKLLIIDTGPGFKSADARAAWNQTAHATAQRFEREGLAVLRDASPERARVTTHRNAEGLARAARGMLAQRDDRVIRGLERVKVPSLVVVGSEDRPFLAASEYMHKKIGGSRKVVIPRAGHAANIDNPEDFNRALLEFLGEGDGEKAKL
ncbi:uncharacterized protein HMPREF1541_07444 [Cyphellophora europaea CBS 101466]|uniref:AB hydrolase-1 domain-containing protein n=1 Tax=Cyphellophora europaea (strain CBS 101466) TaxID=1220924 RepID=W2RMU0_CYPE1|nr:uncharacterized protein HMPREF1541_07444 [Cyphellophora europaea CBS 101466]ETN37821.1 hypothetical protein HMPREF1541_07444 [Cyphellophora europaea CBS 101466]